MNGTQPRIHMGAPCLDSKESDSVFNQVSSGWISQGPRTKEFEHLICTHLNVRHAVAMSNGTATLHSMLLALDVGPGDYVVVPSLTYISSVNVIYLCGAIPIYVDVDPKTLTLDLEGVEAALKNYQPKAVLSVDLKGLPCDYDSLNSLCEHYACYHLADSAESLGAIYKQRPVGSQVLMHSFSMFANKTITCGEGGFVTTNDSNLYDKLISIRNQGQGSKRYEHIMFGCNYRFTDVKAAIAIPQLTKLEGIMQKRSSVIQSILNNLSPSVGFQSVPPYVNRHPYYCFTVLFNSTTHRDEVIRRFDQSNIEWRISFPPCHQQPYHSTLPFESISSLIHTCEAYRTMLDIPCHQNLTEDEILKITNIINDVVN